MTNKEILNQLYKFVEAFGSVQKRLFEIKTRNADEEWITICKITKEDIEQLEKDLEEYEKLKEGLEMTQEEKKEEILKAIELSPTEKMFSNIMWKISMLQSPFIKLEDKYRFTIEEDIFIEKALMKYLYNSDGYVKCDVSKFFEEEQQPADDKKECKYLKTKSGIYERDKCCVVFDYGNTKTELVKINNEQSNGLTTVDFQNIIKQSDDLIDLCDKFILIGKDDEPNEIMDDVEIEHYVKDGYVPESEIYGAIWTDTELKYVCKLNDKGELELI